MKGYFSIGIFVLFGLSGTCQAQYFEDKQNQQLRAHIAALKKNIGKTIWVTGAGWNGGLIELCPSPIDRFKECTALKPGIHFLIKDFQAYGARPPEKPIMYDNLAYRVETSDGRTGWVPTSEYAFYTFEDPKITKEKEISRQRLAVEECARRGQPKIGMTQVEAIETCWGRPKRIVKVTTADGTREDYIYGTGHTLRFESGKVVAIIETQ